VQGTETGVSGAGFSISTGRACCDKFWSAHVRDRPRACLIEETILKPPGQSLMGGSMWDQLKRTDVELARQKLAELRGITVQRHAEELKQLDNDEAEIDTLARLAEAITKKYLNGGAQPNEQPTQGDAARDPARRETEQEESLPASLELRQNVSPNFGTPLRRLVHR